MTSLKRPRSYTHTDDEPVAKRSRTETFASLDRIMLMPGQYDGLCELRDMVISGPRPVQNRLSNTSSRQAFFEFMFHAGGALASCDLDAIYKTLLDKVEVPPSGAPGFCVVAIGFVMQFVALRGLLVGDQPQYGSFQKIQPDSAERKSLIDAARKLAAFRTGFGDHKVLRHILVDVFSHRGKDCETYVRDSEEESWAPILSAGEFNTLWTAATTGREFYRVDGMSTLLEVPVSKPVVISKPVLSALGAGSGSSLGLHMVGAGAKYVNPTVLYNQENRRKQPPSTPPARVAPAFESKALPKMPWSIPAPKKPSSPPATPGATTPKLQQPKKPAVEPKKKPAAPPAAPPKLPEAKKPKEPKDQPKKADILRRAGLGINIIQCDEYPMGSLVDVWMGGESYETMLVLGASTDLHDDPVYIVQAQQENAADELVPSSDIRAYSSESIARGVALDIDDPTLEIASEFKDVIVAGLKDSADIERVIGSVGPSASPPVRLYAKAFDADIRGWLAEYNPSPAFWYARFFNNEIKLEEGIAMTARSRCAFCAHKITTHTMCISTETADQPVCTECAEAMTDLLERARRFALIAALIDAGINPFLPSTRLRCEVDGKSVVSTGPLKLGSKLTFA